MLFEFNDGKEGKCEIGFRFIYPEPKKTYTEPIPVDWLICPLERLAEHIAGYAENGDAEKILEAMQGRMIVDVEPRRVKCICEKFRTYDGKRELEAKLFETVATCHPNDMYRKAVGRFGAFKRAAMTFIDITPEDIIRMNGGESNVRGMIWDAFRNSGCKFPSGAELAEANHYDFDEDEMEATVREPW